jgi:pyoverdine/dityrosine biosynthesis protein Dit1
METMKLTNLAATKLEDKIFRILTNRRFVRFKPDAETKGLIMDKIQRAINKQMPLKIVIGFGYHKNPNATSNLLPDMAEELAIQRLFGLASQVKGVYPRGMEIKIITSGRRAEMVNGMSRYDTLQYHQALVKLVHKMGWDKIVEIIPIGDLYDECREEFQQALLKAKKEVELEKNDSSKISFWFQQIEYARRNIKRKGLDKMEVKNKAEQAAFRYVMFRKAETMINLIEKKFPGSIQASYNKGHKNTLTLWTLRKGYITQPWQGTAKMVDGKIEVITQTRKNN